jgi:hypothetical protein
MPDPTNPNTPATTASNSMASAPSWEQFVGQYYKPQAAPYIRSGNQTPTFLDPFSGMGVGFGRMTGRNDPSSGWAALINSGLLNQYGITNANEFMNYYGSLPGSDRRASGVDIMQQAFRDWQLRQMQQQSQNQQQPTQPTTPPAASQNQTVTFGTQQTLNDFANTPPVASPLGSYAAALLASMNAAPVATTTPGVQSSPIAAYINYLMGN